VCPGLRPSPGIAMALSPSRKPVQASRPAGGRSTSASANRASLSLAGVSSRSRSNPSHRGAVETRVAGIGEQLQDCQRVVERDRRQLGGGCLDDRKVAGGQGPLESQDERPTGLAVDLSHGKHPPITGNEDPRQTLRDRRKALQIRRTRRRWHTTDNRCAPVRVPRLSKAIASPDAMDLRCPLR
jgi:hypothetical protein